jgi:hypothetical protein
MCCKHEYVGTPRRFKPRPKVYECRRDPCRIASKPKVKMKTTDRSSAIDFWYGCRTSGRVESVLELESSPNKTQAVRLCLPPSLCLATALFLASTPLATRGQSIHQLYHRSWTVREGAPSSVTCIAQTADGFLWLGGEDGYIEWSTLDSNE